MFDADDPLLARLRGICLAFPDAAEKVSHGRPNWFTTKVFAVFGGSVKGEHGSRLLSRALERLSLGDREGAGEAFLTFCDYIRARETRHQPRLDVYRVIEVATKYTGFSRS